MLDSNIDMSTQQEEVKYKVGKLLLAQQKLATDITDLAANQGELETAVTYQASLKTSCVDSGSDYEQRSVRRKARKKK